MADEIQATFGLSFSNGGAIDAITSATTKITQATLAAHASVVFVGTSEEDIAVGDINTANGYWLAMKNLDSTNFVKYGPKASGSMVEFGRIKKGTGWHWLFVAPNVVLRWVADTAQVKVQIKAFEA
jgi:hypothetical protein